MTADESRPGVDAELAGLLAGIPLAPVTTAEALEQVRPYSSAPIGPILEGRGISLREVTVAVGDGASIMLSVFTPSDVVADAPCVYWLHGGGMIMGDRFSQIDIPLEWAEELGAVVVSAEYRLAPEVTGTTLVEDSYAGLAWVVGRASELGIDPSGIIIAGTSAGGGIAAGTALMARDRGEIALAGQVLICPMLDHRNTTPSSHQYTGGGVWPRETNEFAWGAVLADTGSEISPYVSPSLADRLSGLPPTFVDAGSAEVFRDECVAYASGIWASGGQAELHVWAGGFHGFDALFPTARLSMQARTTRTAWLTRLLDERGRSAGSAGGGPSGGRAAAGHDAREQRGDDSPRDQPEGDRPE